VRFIGEPIQLSEQQRTDLHEIAQSRSLPAGFLFRAKLILMLAEGVPFAVIKEQLQIARRPARAGNSGSWKMDWKVWIRIIRDNRLSS
jgi:hypothetical protein